MSVYVNRSLNLKKIRAIGFDMDYTIVRYHTNEFEKFAYYAILEKMVTDLNYPNEILKLKYAPELTLQGLVIDKKHGNILKLSRYGQVKNSFHGVHRIDFKDQQKIYKRRVVDLNDPTIQSLDTAFSISNGVLYAQLVQLKKEGIIQLGHDALADDIKETIDVVHRDGTLKTEVKNNISKYIIQDPDLPPLLEKYKDYGKKLLVITNSDYAYCKLLLDYTITPFLKKYKNWSEVFELVITSAAKPVFFNSPQAFLKVDTDTGSLQNFNGAITNGVYQGGNAGKLQNDLALDGDEILYLGDHIYGDVVALKKTFNWRTALVLNELDEEVKNIKKATKVQQLLDENMQSKESLELDLNNLFTQEHELNQKVGKNEISEIFDKIEKKNSEAGHFIDQYNDCFNHNWGELMRAGQEESRFADQVEKYACIYMSKISDLLEFSPRTYFRPLKRWMPHEL